MSGGRALPLNAEGWAGCCLALSRRGLIPWLRYDLCGLRLRRIETNRIAISDDKLRFLDPLLTTTVFTLPGGKNGGQERIVLG